MDQKQFWYLLKRDKKKPVNGVTLRNECGDIVTDKQDVSSMWYNHFETLAKWTEDRNYDEDFKSHVNERTEQFSKSDEETEGADNVLTVPVSKEEIEKICLKLKCGKAQDKSGLQGEHFKYAGPSVRYGHEQLQRDHHTKYFL